MSVSVVLPVFRPYKSTCNEWSSAALSQPKSTRELGQFDEPYAVRKLIGRAGAKLKDKTGLARPSHAGPRRKAILMNVLGEFQAQGFAPTKLVYCVGRLFRRLVSERSGGKSSGRSSASS